MPSRQRPRSASRRWRSSSRSRLYFLVTAPSSNGRTSDFGSGNGGSNPPGAIPLSHDILLARPIREEDVDRAAAPFVVERVACALHDLGPEAFSRETAPVRAGAVDV